MSGAVAILLGAYGAAPFLTEQLESLALQTHGDWSLVISFDGDSDAARAQVAEFAAAHPSHLVRMLDGPGKGFAANFLHLLGHVPDDADHVAFCDHDDVWCPDKLARSLDKIAGEDGPAITCGRTRICSETLEPYAESPLFRKPPGFGNALLQSLGGGNTMLFNRGALEVLLWARPHAGRAVAHDWWAYQVLSGVGARIVYDPAPRMLYRQHDGNLFGTNAMLRARLSRVRQVFRGRLRDWSGRTVETLMPLRARLTPENARRLERFAEARTAPLARRVRLMRAAGVYRQTRAEQALFWLAVLLGKV